MEHPKIVASRGRGDMFYAPEAASQSFVVGNLVYLSDGKVAQASNATKIAGIADIAASGVTSTDSHFLEVRAGDILEMSTVSDGTATAASGLTIGSAYGISDVSDVTCVDAADALNPQLIFRGEVETLDGSTSYRGYFEIATNAAQFGVPSVAGQMEMVSIPIDVVASTSEQDTGYDIPDDAIVYDVFIKVDTAEATGGTKTIDVGTLSSDSGDADGFLDGVSTAGTGVVRGVPTFTAGSSETYFASSTKGALLAPTKVAGSDTATDVGTYLELPCTDPGSQSVTYTLGSNDWSEFVGSIVIVMLRTA